MRVGREEEDNVKKKERKRKARSRVGPKNTGRKKRRG